MLHFEGDRDFALAPGALWSKLRDARFLVSCVPDATIHGAAQIDRAECSIKPGLGFVSGRLDTSIAIVDAHEPTDLRFLIASKGIGSSSEVETTLTFASTDKGARVHWSADIKRLGGLLKAVPSGLIRGAAQKTIDEVWQEIERKVRE